MSLNDALFLVDRDGTNHHSKGSDIGSRAISGDKILVQRNGKQFTAAYDGVEWSRLQDSDLLVAWDGAETRRVTGSNFKALFLPPPEIVTLPKIRNTGQTNGYGQLLYELVTPATWSRPSDRRGGVWEYTRDGDYWYGRTDSYGTYYYDNNVLKVRYEDKHLFGNSWYYATSEEYPIGKPT